MPSTPPSKYSTSALTVPPPSLPVLGTARAVGIAAGPLVRSATLEDAALIRDLINEVDLIDTGSGGYSVEEVRADLRRAADLARDSFLAFAAGRLVAYAVLWPASSGGRLDVDHYVSRSHVRTGARLLDRVTARAGEIAAAAGRPDVELHLALTPESVLAVHALPSRGWRSVRRHHVLTRAVSPATDPLPWLPPGVIIRPVAGPAGEHVAYRLVQETFVEHFGFEASTYPDWRKQMDADHRDWSLTWIALLDGRNVGVCLAHNDRETTGWVQNLGTVAGLRGQGIGTALLRTAFAEFARRDRHTVGLGVDTANVTNAVRFYTGLGMTLQFAADTWQLRVPAL